MSETTMTDLPETMTGETLDIAEQRRAELKQLFPGVFTETTGDNGEVVETVDFERLKAELGSFTDVYEGRRERYGMDWPGKRDCMKLIQEPTRATLKPCREESVDFDNTKNLFIEGDNLEVLKLFQKSYYGKVKMIYIDPPYNTGREFIYPDNYQESLETYLAYSGQVDDDGKKFSTNTASEGRFHTRWLNMMYPRLYLARNLLRDDGAVFVSIDDNELENLRRVLDELFGEENFIGMISRATGTRMGSGSRGIARELDYILVYSKTDAYQLSRLPMTKEEAAIYNEEDERGRYLLRSLRRTGGENRREDRPSMFFPVTAPDGTEVLPLAPEGWESRWVCGRDTYDQLLQSDDIVWKQVNKNGELKWQVYQKTYMSEEGRESSDLWAKEDGNKKATREVNALFGGTKVFDHPKPVGLMKKIIQLGTNKLDESIVLDFFAGSGSMGHAVYEKNIEDGGNRRFILVQLPEMLSEESQGKKLGYETIADISKDRLRRSAESLANGSEGQLNFGVSSQNDGAFKVCKLGPSTFQKWQTASEISKENLEQQLQLHVNNVDDLATQEEILYELLLKAGFELTVQIDELEVVGKTVFSVAEGALMICLEEELTAGFIDAVADLEPMQFICLDKGFNGNDQLKANAVQTFKSRSQNSESEFVFKVV
ncbi:site-specific DNA-methyltransferase [Halioxenophilus aromaticivorans]|uniref:site-specific DNA-methyltransferase (adenine-specific) n=1 Tax=Halioxenophilus aromaticivorans TaxID=1306992 RepID=A0AAV3U9P2_9ALTE